MATPLIIRSPAATLTMTLMAAWLVVCSTASRMVGGKTEVANVRTNDEVQELGRFAVEEYNRSVKIWKEGEGEGKLRFVEVVEAQQQVVSGIKYYMKIWVTQAKSDGVGDPTMFDSVVLVKPWLNSKHLLHFAPSPQ